MAGACLTTASFWREIQGRRYRNAFFRFHAGFEAVNLKWWL